MNATSHTKTLTGEQNASLTEELIARHAPGVKTRARVEVAICHRLLRDLSAAGYSMHIDDGDEDAPVHDHVAAMRLLFNLDEARIIVRHANLRSSFVLLVFGNDGYDLISDYGMSLEPVIEPISAWIDAAQNAGLCPQQEAR